MENKEDFKNQGDMIKKRLSSWFSKGLNNAKFSLHMKWKAHLGQINQDWRNFTRTHGRQKMTIFKTVLKARGTEHEVKFKFKMYISAIKAPSMMSTRKKWITWFGKQKRGKKITYDHHNNEFITNKKWINNNWHWWLVEYYVHQRSVQFNHSDLWNSLLKM